ncbi:MAG: hypothetical protein SPK61_00970 [Bacteroidales bacterium]|nr:hypothetical protein [Bacteroidales bacterium]
MNQKSKYEIAQTKKQLDLLQHSDLFDNAPAGGLCLLKDEKTKQVFWRASRKIIVHNESIKNLYEPIREQGLKYFELNDIAWWNEYKERYFPTGHTLSSQIHCLNHLFALQGDKNAVLSMVQAILPDITDIQPSPIDENDSEICKINQLPNPSYITFEFTYNNKEYLQETCNKRGARCTSVDALIYAIDNKGQYVLIPVEWKYTEHYSFEDRYRASDEKIKKRYSPLTKYDNTRISEWKEYYYFDPYYELARQTLLMEQIIRNKPFTADRFEHIVVCPKDNKDMWNCAENFKESIKGEHKHFFVIDPQDLLEPVRGYDNLKRYLKTRYWE